MNMICKPYNPESNDRSRTVERDSIIHLRGSKFDIARTSRKGPGTISNDGTLCKTGYFHTMKSDRKRLVTCEHCIKRMSKA